MVPDDASAEDIIMHRESSGLYQVEWNGGEVMSFEVDFCLILLMAENPAEVGSLSHYLLGFSTIQTVVLGFLPLTVPVVWWWFQRVSIFTTWGNAPKGLKPATRYTRLASSKLILNPYDDYG